MDESAFDLAANRPFLDSPTKKKWNWRKALRLPQTRVVEEEEDVEEGIPLCITYRSDDLLFANASLYDGEEYKVNDDFVVEIEEQRGLTAVDFQHAVLQEREQDIREINHSMRYMNEIQRDLATVVNQQEEGILQIRDTTLETMHQTAGALSHLISLQQRMATVRKNRRFSFWVAGVGVTATAGLYWMMSLGENEDGSPQH
ncbi:hypothetical protein FisN_21Lh258 [Fistulifera solaris]|uniref:t-SNARE coiled-coil homology domain-containing protein n=1 Tax=Fistulifera solaris TaxID=1519565 RepID=A0A1Z5KE83_FISSO|nr:hypothetical protein FisN_21Lh258 [Fistulifera solaris]|eukprot:GAX24640.1 hypothetical protein FisN_21Lh258 [Fistulifera solaris]